jgi:hypothetical protein
MKTKKSTNYYSIMYEVKKGDSFFPTTISELVRNITRDERKNKLKKIMLLNEKENS